MHGIYPEAKKVDPSRSIKVIVDDLVFDRTDFIRRLTITNGIGADAERIMLLIQRVILEILKGDLRKFINFHDFMTLCYEGLKRRR